MDFNKLCVEILKLNPKIRYAGVYNTYSGKVFEKPQKGLARLFDKEQTRKSLIQAYMRWKTRESFVDISGEPIYAMTKYQKINRITVPCGKNSLLMVTTENDLEPHEIVDDIMILIEKLADENENALTIKRQLNF